MDAKEQIQELQSVFDYMQMRLKTIEDLVRKQQKKLNSRADRKLRRPAAARYLGYSPQHFKRLMDQYPQYLTFTNKEITINQLDVFEDMYKQKKGVRL